MSKVFIQFTLIVFIIANSISCAQKQDDQMVTAIEGINTIDTSADEGDFFPVTNYIKGQVYEIKNNHINPLMIINNGSKIDSVYLKMEELDAAVVSFLEPVIDSSNLKEAFTQTSFKDATLNKIIFNYTPTIMHPVGNPLKTWNVYIDPETGKISGVYILKITAGKGTEHLNWIADEKCTQQLLKDDKLVYERSIIWNFDKND
jgi:hypothetical protein